MTGRRSTVKEEVVKPTPKKKAKETLSPKSAKNQGSAGDDLASPVPKTRSAKKSLQQANPTEAVEKQTEEDLELATPKSRASTKAKPSTKKKPIVEEAISPSPKTKTPKKGRGRKKATVPQDAIDENEPSSSTQKPEPKEKPKKYIFIDAPFDDNEEVVNPEDELDEDFILEPPKTSSKPSTSQDNSDESASEEGEAEREEVEDGPRKKREKKTAVNQLRCLFSALEPKVSETNFCPDVATPYLSYDPNWWSPEYLYRLPADIALDTIRESGGEGIGRIEIGKKLGMDTSTKSGNRRVSGFIHSVCAEKKDYVGQFQKMEGKVRNIKYYWKASTEPQSFIKLFDDFKRLSGGRECPFKMGQVIKFPNSNLSTLRMSDVSLRRVNFLLELVNDQRVIVTIQRTLKLIEAKEKAVGYPYQIDKKSLLKCLSAMESEKLLSTFETTVVSENVSNQIHIICHPSIPSADCPEVTDATQKTIDTYNREGRLFPHGQLRYSLKRRADGSSKGKEQPAPEPLPLKNNIDMEGAIEILDRFRIHRQLTSRALVVPNLKKKEVEESEETADETQSTIDEVPAEGSEIDQTTIVFGQEEDEKNVTLLHGDGTQTDMLTSVIAASGKNPLRRMKTRVEMVTGYGYQAKAIRWFIMHEVVFQMVHGHELDTTPTLYDRFPPGEDIAFWPERSVDELPVYVNDESCLRFVPPLRPFKDVKRGWIFLEDVAHALPLSVFVLLAYIGKDVPIPLLHEYLSHPIKRHICLGDLPIELRIPLLRDKKAYRQLEHTMLMLCALGLMALGKSPDPKRFLNPTATMYYVANKGVLYDTSTSQRGYATVTLPLSRYDKYEYDFTCVDDLVVYWHHLRAIIQSTPLSFRNDFSSNDVLIGRHKKYSLGLVDRSRFAIDLKTDPIELHPVEPADGCAGFDSCLFLHLRRHWDLNPKPSKFVAWFIGRFRRQAENVKDLVETRVEKLKADWNSYVKSLMPSDVHLTKNKKALASATSNGVYPSSRGSIAIEPKSRTRLPQPRRTLEARKKKRQLDSVDMVSEQSRINIRSRFNSRERDMLILIRAIGFFLNPVYRFWLDPAVLRDIMHEYVPESRTKTVQSLMAAGVREMVRPQRLAYLQRIVRNLSTFQEMRNLRFQLASAPLGTPEAKTTFFKNAFDIANRLLFLENQSVPHVTTKDEDFADFLKNGKVVVSAEQSSSNPMPLRSRQPVTLAHIHHCVAINILLSILLHATDGSFSEKILEQISATVIYQALQVLRSDGLVSRTRSLDPELQVITKNQAVLSFYFRHFFSHRFHPDILEQTRESCLFLDEASISSDGDATVPLEIDGDTAGVLIVAASTFYTGIELDISVDEEILAVFESTADENSSQSTKQIRYLENADLRIEQIRLTTYPAPEVAELPRWQDLVKLIDRSQPEDQPIVPLPDFLAQSDEGDVSNLTAIHRTISKTAAFGANMADIVSECGLSRCEVRRLLDQMIEARLIIDVGVDSHRWVDSEYSAAWCVVVDGRRVCPRPWTLPTGGICESTIRWMTECVMMSVVANPGILLKDLYFRFEFALQPAGLDDLVQVLQAAGCLNVCEEVFENMELDSPFQDNVPKTLCTYLLPAVGCVERFARIFGGIPLLPSVTSSSEKSNETENETKPRNITMGRVDGFNLS